MAAELRRSYRSGRNISLNLDILDFPEDQQITVRDAVTSIAERAKSLLTSKATSEPDQQKTLPDRISFPYARHSSLPELREFVRLFKPRGIWPCTVEPALWHKNGITMRKFFGDLCSGDAFEHDTTMAVAFSDLDRQDQPDSQQTSTSLSTADYLGPSSPHLASSPAELHQNPPSPTIAGVDSPAPGERASAPVATGCATHRPVLPQKRARADESLGEYEATGNSGDEDDFWREAGEEDSQSPALSTQARETRRRAFKAAQENAEGGRDWQTVGLISTTDNHSTVEAELGGP